VKADEDPDPSNAATPEALQDRIDSLRRGGSDRKERESVSRALALVMSMGVTMAGAMYAGYLLGNYLVRQTGNGLYLPGMLLLSAVGGGIMVFQMLRPFFKGP